MYNKVLDYIAHMLFKSITPPPDEKEYVIRERVYADGTKDFQPLFVIDESVTIKLSEKAFSSYEGALSVVKNHKSKKVMTVTDNYV